MTTTLFQSSATPTGTRRGGSSRDAGIDAVRAACLLAVVVLHALMVGAQPDAHGALRTSVALSGEPWFAPITWLLQVMPMFFIAGGFAALSQWRAMRARGATAREYVLGRVRRLAAPAAMMIAAVSGALLLAGALGADPALLAEASLRIGQPLWFLAVYLGATALVPAMTRLHERAPRTVLLALAGGVIAVEVLARILAEPLGYLNLAFVWLLMQQLGFAMRDGACAAWSRRRLTIAAAVPLAVLLVLIGCGWSADMIENLNPPTAAIALLGVAQFFVLQRIRPGLARLTAVPAVAACVGAASRHSMSVYLWHMPVILVLVALMWLGGLPMPAPHSGAWWATRLPWLLAIAVCVLPVAVLATRYGSRPRPPRRPGSGRRAPPSCGVRPARSPCSWRSPAHRPRSSRAWIRCRPAARPSPCSSAACWSRRDANGSRLGAALRSHCRVPQPSSR